MVDSRQAVMTRMVLSMTPAAAMRSRERTTYQLQPETIHVNSGMLPAAALSNFFKAPATPIHSKLPSISISRGGPVHHSTKSIHQRNKCLAEIIQTQLMELKKLQDKSRCKTEAKTSYRIQKSGYGEDSSGSPTKSSSSNTHRHNTQTNRLISTDVGRLTIRSPPGLPSKSSENVNTTNLSRTITRTSLPIPKVSALPLKENRSPQIFLAATEQAEPADKKRLEITRSHTLFIQKEPLPETHTVQQTHAMDPVKITSIENWIKSVELAHKLEGKCSDVISIPSPL